MTFDLNSGLLTVIVLLLGWIRLDVGHLMRRVDAHLDGHP
jgi:hypothetical protein